MKFPAIVALVLLMALPTRADEPTGIRFFAGSWQQALAESQRTGKPLFVDFYANWCPPCQRMAREAFPNTDIGDAYNARFINYQINAETGEGPELVRRYIVGSYPTALFLTPAGQIVHRAVGYGGIAAMLKQADWVLRLRPMRQSLRHYKQPHP